MVTHRRMFWRNMRWVASQITINQKFKFHFFTLKNKKFQNLFLNIMFEEGFIRHYEIIKNNSYDYVKIFLKYEHSNEHPVLNKVFFYTKNLKKSEITKKKLLILIKKYPTSLFIINTEIGLITHKKALKFNKFGTLIVKIN